MDPSKERSLNILKIFEVNQTNVAVSSYANSDFACYANV